jgi:hypothetical protein
MTEVLYSETVRQAEQQRARAIQYEGLINLRNSSRDKIAKLEGVVFDEKSLTRIIELANGIDRTLLTHSNFASPGGSLVYLELIQIASGAIPDLRAKAEKHQNKLERARQDLARTEAALAEFA